MKEDIYQVLMIGLQGFELSSKEEHLIANYNPGAVILFNRNISTPSQVADLCSRLYELSAVPPLIAVDQEGGSVNRLRSLLNSDISPPDIARRGDTESIRSFGRITGEMLSALGINLNLAPVLDLAVTDADNALRQRCWGSEANAVIDKASAYLDGLQGTGVFGCLKHFPGLGRAEADSHHRLPEVHTSLEELFAEDFVPFSRLADRTSFVLVAHCKYIAINGDSGPPSSLCSNIYRILREDIGFQGVALTDDLEMGALGYIDSWEEKISAALNAGADMLPICNDPTNIEQAFEITGRIHQQKKVNPERWNQAKARIMEAKASLPIAFNPGPDLAKRFAFLNDELYQLRQEITGDEKKA